MSPSQLISALMGGARKRLAKTSQGFAWPVLLYRPGTGPKPELPRVDGMEALPSWPAVIARIREQHPGVDSLRVVVYPCAPLQILESAPSPELVLAAHPAQVVKESLP